jgi:hypothetical protein
MRRFRYEYGASPAHLVAGGASLAVGVWALWKVLGLLGMPHNFVKWFVGAILLHDLVFLTLYSAVGVAVAALILRRRPTRLRIAALNHLRVPALLSGLALLVWFPLILRKAPGSFERLTGHANDYYMGRWLALCGVLFAGSALLFVARLRSLRTDEPHSDA